jgi:hypothetical protein
VVCSQAEQTSAPLWIYKRHKVKKHHSKNCKMRFDTQVYEYFNIHLTALNQPHKFVPEIFVYNNITLNIAKCFGPQRDLHQGTLLLFPDNGTLRTETCSDIQRDIII